MTDRLPAGPGEIERLHAVAARELSDAAVGGLSVDGQFEHAFAAALALATAALRTAGLRVHGPDHHRATFEAFARLEDGRWAELADFLQHCRRRRNVVAYDMTRRTTSRHDRTRNE